MRKIHWLFRVYISGPFFSEILNLNVLAFSLCVWAHPCHRPKGGPVATPQFQALKPAQWAKCLNIENIWWKRGVQHFPCSAWVVCGLSRISFRLMAAKTSFVRKSARVMAGRCGTIAYMAAWSSSSTGSCNCSKMSRAAPFSSECFGHFW